MDEQSIEGLILGGGCELAINSEVGQEGFDLFFSHACGMPFVVKENEEADPVQVLIFCAAGIVFEADCAAYLIEQFAGCRIHRTH